ncbi:DUF4349 domain-containing protein [Paenibacillus melissococcoides]|uniref:DUF4349 domain-containing protein n=1 Tax=Paenibacillus melissococcoides TaxID=2912268 RepID=A0ABM9G0W7_9BACL|nr:MULTISPECIES: hypothetical protein [Paenibacillus]MEB9893060.1 hypothetical protein [Bacillus cereus]CAH8245227.1 DUF4349 domain-containing protein [Paenibacillus melissococcoides]CAH8710346.1 DUF4349 domain-containing protein [Paenibacillus melissococcoides]CAH8711115.1 DUF4349 domain-containing protein [Paenibacillus melissococcoides]GIO78893.1 hypothetical protein J6TS7_25030 [Paenibacillus dendritiformis]
MQSEIEQLVGRKRYFDNHAAMSTHPYETVLLVKRRRGRRRHPQDEAISAEADTGNKK